MHNCKHLAHARVETHAPSLGPRRLRGSAGHPAPVPPPTPSDGSVVSYPLVVVKLATRGHHGWDRRERGTLIAKADTDRLDAWQTRIRPSRLGSGRADSDRAKLTWIRPGARQTWIGQRCVRNTCMLCWLYSPMLHRGTPDRSPALPGHVIPC
jgi:hypothetical protein